MAPAPQHPRLLLLGGPGLLVEGTPVVVALPSLRVLAHLAVRQRHRPIARSLVAERLWPDAPPGRATSNLRAALWRLPRSRGRQVVEATASSVSLAADLEVDLWEASDLAATLCSPPAPAVDLPVDLPVDLQVDLPGDLGLLADDLLPDWDDDWLEVERESHRQQRLHALEQSSARLLLAGRYPAALSAGLAALHADALRETAHRRVIEVHLTEGNHAEALQQFDRYRRLMARELGLPPSPAIRRLVSQLVGRPLDA